VPWLATPPVDRGTSLLLIAALKGGVAKRGLRAAKKLSLLRLADPYSVRQTRRTTPERQAAQQGGIIVELCKDHC
jgi:hypothetical protein